MVELVFLEGNSMKHLLAAEALESFLAVLDYYPVVVLAELYMQSCSQLVVLLVNLVCDSTAVGCV